METEVTKISIGKGEGSPQQVLKRVLAIGDDLVDVMICYTAMKPGGEKGRFGQVTWSRMSKHDIAYSCKLIESDTLNCLAEVYDNPDAGL